MGLVTMMLSMPCHCPFVEGQHFRAKLGYLCVQLACLGKWLKQISYHLIHSF